MKILLHDSYTIIMIIQIVWHLGIPPYILVYIYTIINLSILFVHAASPPAPGRPYVIRAQSTSITIGWPEVCDGGHGLRSFTIRYDRVVGYYSYRYVRNIDPSRRNYTVTGLVSSTQYSFWVQAVSLNSRTSSYSSSMSTYTLAPGMHCIV